MTDPGDTCSGWVYRDPKCWLLPEEGFIPFFSGWDNAPLYDIRGAVEDLPRKVQWGLYSSERLRRGDVAIEIPIHCSEMLLMKSGDFELEVGPGRIRNAAWAYMDAKFYYLYVADFDRDFLNDMADQVEKLAYTL